LRGLLVNRLGQICQSSHSLPNRSAIAPRNLPIFFDGSET
jgi:hypothetical protein